jgi:hypothetical protein
MSLVAAATPLAMISVDSMRDVLSSRAAFTRAVGHAAQIRQNKGQAPIARSI